MANRSQIRWIEETDSTQYELARHISDYDNMSVVAARYQTSGRGQRGNEWLSGRGENLTFSMLLRFGDGQVPAVRAVEQFKVTRAATLGVAAYLQLSGFDCTVKWPNDIYIRNKKICGMLIENILSGDEIAFSIIGIGLNVNQGFFPSQLTNPTSMYLVSGMKYRLEDELIKLHSCLVDSFNNNLTSDSSLPRFEDLLYRRGEFHEYVRCSDGSSFEAKIIGTTPAGLLILENRKGELEEFAFKEISFVI